MKNDDAKQSDDGPEEGAALERVQSFELIDAVHSTDGSEKETVSGGRFRKFLTNT